MEQKFLGAKVPRHFCSWGWCTR